MTDITELYIRKFQSTLLQEERRLSAESYEVLGDISIHAPTRGATPDREPGNGQPEISIHAPTRGATQHR